MSEDSGVLPGQDLPSGGVRSRKPKRARPAHGEALGILNPYGDIWTHETFRSEFAAKAYVRAFWATIQGHGVDVDKFTVVRVKVTVSAIADTTEPQVSPGRTK